MPPRVDPNKPLSPQAQRTLKILQLRQEGLTIIQIGEAVGLTHQRISQILRQQARAVEKDIQSHARAIRAAQIDQLSYVVSASLEAWRKSTQPRKTVTRRTVAIKDRDGKPTAAPVQETTVMHSEERTGDTRYLVTALQALASQRELLGLNAPTMIKWEIMDRAKEVAASLGFTQAETAEMVALADSFVREQSRRGHA